MWKVPLFDTAFDEKEVEAAQRVIRSGWLTMGEVTQEFEQRFAEFLRVKHAIAVSSCTAALHLANRALGIGQGDEVICPSLTFVAAANSIVYTGARPVFANIESLDDFSISPQDIEAKITQRTKAIQVVRSSPVITLKLKSNPSTGFSWFLVGYDHGLLVPISRVFVPPTKEMPGAPGYEIWRFGVSPHAFVVPQMTYITLRYLRPWVVPANARKLKFTVAIQEMAQPKAK